MKATVYYIELDKEQVKALNAEGWGSTIGKAYLAAKDGRIDSTNFDLLAKAATFDDAPSAEHIWVSMQNREKPWMSLAFLTCHTPFPRSMDVGDIVVWEDGTRERCASTGFTPIKEA